MRQSPAPCPHAAAPSTLHTQSAPDRSSSVPNASLALVVLQPTIGHLAAHKSLRALLALEVTHITAGLLYTHQPPRPLLTLVTLVVQHTAAAGWHEAHQSLRPQLLSPLEVPHTAVDVLAAHPVLRALLALEVVHPKFG
eukprot:scaffold71475_cov67-Phaeocystis_antarctica.AAC.3